jgi:multidrug efflux pump subunit AcrA (membrane-fusion protein)
MLIVCGVIVVALAAASMSVATSSNDTGPKLLHTVKRSDLAVSVTEQGTLESSNNTEIKCKVRGYSTVIWVIEGGTEVKPGDELVRLDTKNIEETVSLQKTNVHIATATLERSKADVAKAEISIDAYLEGQFRSQLKRLEKEISVAESNLSTAEKMLEHSKAMFKRGYVSELEVKGNEFTVAQANLELKVKQTEIDVLKKYTKEMNLETLNGNLIANKSKLEADKAGLAMDEARRHRALEELDACVVTADRSGLVIYPSAAAWKDAPDIAEGANVRQDQVLLLMPDLSKMQVKVGIHESIIDRIKPGLKARVTLPDRTLEATVSSVSPVTRPAGWWTGNVVKYDTIIELPEGEGLKPGMSAEVEVVMARHTDVLTIPVSAVMETKDGDFCWVSTTDGAQKRAVKLGDTNDVFMIVESGLEEGDQVVLNPLALVEEAKSEVLKSLGNVTPQKVESVEPDSSLTGIESQSPLNEVSP